MIGVIKNLVEGDFYFVTTHLRTWEERRWEEHEPPLHWNEQTSNRYEREGGTRASQCNQRFIEVGETQASHVTGGDILAEW